MKSRLIDTIFRNPPSLSSHETYEMTITIASLQSRHSSVEEFSQSPPEDLHIFLNEVGPIEVGFLDYEHQGQVLLHHPQAEVLVFLFVGELHVGRRVLVVLVPIFVVEVGDVDEDVQHVRTNVVLQLVWQFFIIVSDVQFGDEVKKIDLLELAVVRQVVEKFGDVGRAGNHPLNDSAEGFEDRRIIDGGEEELYFFYIDVVLPNFFFEFYLVLRPDVLLAEVDVGLVDEYEHAAVVGVLALEVLVDIVEGVASLVKVG